MYKNREYDGEGVKLTITRPKRRMPVEYMI